MDIIISAPIKYDNRIVGVVVGYKPAKEFYNIAGNIQVGDSGFAFVLNDVADVIAHPTVISGATKEEGGENVSFSNLKDRVPDKYKADVIEIDEKIQKDEAGIGKYYDNGKIQYLGFAPIKSKGWTLLIDIDQSEMLAGLDALKTTLFIAVFAAIIIGIVFSLILSKNLTKPIVQITERSYELAQLDLSEDMNENLTKRKDELGVLANSIQTVIENMRDFALEIQESSHQVAAASQELSAIAEESTAAATHIAESSNEVAEGSNAQLGEILNISSSIQEISVQVENVAKDVFVK